MKRAVLAATLAVMASAAWAQAKPAEATSTATPQASSKASPQDAAKVQSVARKSRRAEDARHCLEKGSNTEIIKCAEAFL